MWRVLKYRCGEKISLVIKSFNVKHLSIDVSIHFASLQKAFMNPLESYE